MRLGFMGERKGIESAVSDRQGKRRQKLQEGRIAPVNGEEQQLAGIVAQGGVDKNIAAFAHGIES